MPERNWQTVCLCLCRGRSCERGSIKSRSDTRHVSVWRLHHQRQSLTKCSEGKNVCVRTGKGHGRICMVDVWKYEEVKYAYVLENTYERYAWLLPCVNVCVCMRVCLAMSAGWGGGRCFGSRSGTSFRPKPAEKRGGGGRKQIGMKVCLLSCDMLHLYLTITKNSWFRQTKYRSSQLNTVLH